LFTFGRLAQIGRATARQAVGPRCETGSAHSFFQKQTVVCGMTATTVVAAATTAITGLRPVHPGPFLPIGSFEPVAGVAQNDAFGQFAFAADTGPGPDRIRDFRLAAEVMKLKPGDRAAETTRLIGEVLRSPLREPSPLIFTLKLRRGAWHRPCSLPRNRSHFPPPVFAPGAGSPGGPAGDAALVASPPCPTGNPSVRVKTRYVNEKRMSSITFRQIIMS
jgi:hypothetical protein